MLTENGNNSAMRIVHTCCGAVESGDSQSWRLEVGVVGASGGVC